MAQQVREIKGKAVLSINDRPDIWRCFEGLQMEIVPINYQVGGGPRGWSEMS